MTSLVNSWWLFALIPIGCVVVAALFVGFILFLEWFDPNGDLSI